MKNITFYTLLSLSILMHCAYAQLDLSAEHKYPGGLVVLKIDKTSVEVPIVRYGMQQALILDQTDRWLALIGISLDTTPGDYVAYIDTQTKAHPSYHDSFTIKPKDYPVLNPQVRDLIKDSDKPAYVSFSDIDFENSQQPFLPFIYPIPKQSTRTLINGQAIENPSTNILDRWHTIFGYINLENKGKQIDFICFMGTTAQQVVAPQHAIVSKIIRNDQGVSTLFLDHGRGLYSILSGLSDVYITQGKGISQGDIIGKASDKYLFKWQTIINKTYVNPTLFTDR